MNKNKNRIIALLLAGNALITAGCSAKKAESPRFEDNQEIVSVDNTDAENRYVLTTEDGTKVLLENATAEEIAQYLTQNNFADQAHYDYTYEDSAVHVVEEDYEELTTEKFEDLSSSVIYRLTKDYVDVNGFSQEQIDAIGLVEYYRNLFGPLNLDSADIIKYVAVVNIDKLATDNPTLLNDIIGDQNIDSVMESAYRVMGEMLMYNYNNYYATGSTEGFLRVSDAVFDPVMKQRVIAIEKRVDEIAIASQNDHGYMNTLIQSLFEDMLNPENELSYLDEGVGFATTSVMLEPIRGLFGMDLEGNSLLNETNNNLVKYFVSYVGDEDEYVENALVTGYYLNVNDILRDCTKNGTYTRTLGE